MTTAIQAIVFDIIEKASSIRRFDLQNTEHRQRALEHARQARRQATKLIEQLTLLEASTDYDEAPRDARRRLVVWNIDPSDGIKTVVWIGEAKKPTRKVTEDFLRRAAKRDGVMLEPPSFLSWELVKEE